MVRRAARIARKVASPRRGRAQLDAAPLRAERADRLPDRLAHAEREHERRFADRLRAVDGAVLRGVLEQAHVEHVGHLREARQLVGARRLREQPPAARAVARVPAQLLEREPSGALHEGALDLAEVDDRRERVADVVEDVDPQHPVRAREPVDLDLRRGRPVGEVLERLALHPLGVPVQALGAVEARRRELHALVVRGLGDLGERERGSACAHRDRPEAGDPPARESHVALVDPEHPPGDRGHAVADLLAGVLHRAAVEVGARRGGGGRGVGHLVGARRGEPHRLERHAECRGGDLQHLRVQALAHLGAAVVHQHRAVLVHVHERAGLVVGGEGERDAELHGRDREGALHVVVLVR